MIRQAIVISVVPISPIADKTDTDIFTHTIGRYLSDTDIFEVSLTVYKTIG